MNAENILKKLGITEDVIAIFPYGSHVYGTTDNDSDYDYIIVMKSGMLSNGAFKNNAISNENGNIQGVIYSRGGFIDAINNYEIGALECLSLDPSDVILKKWPFKVTKWNNGEMVKKIIQKASASWHIADQQAKSAFKDRAKKGIFHALRILNFGLQLKEHQKIVDFTVCNDLYKKFQKLDLNHFDTRDYISIRDDLIKKLRK